MKNCKQIWKTIKSSSNVYTYAVKLTNVTLTKFGEKEIIKYCTDNFGPGGNIPCTIENKWTYNYNNDTLFFKEKNDMLQFILSR